VTLRLYDTRTRRKVEVRVPEPGDPLTMYVCGPTVYGRAHIGNARPAVVFDVLARLIRHLHGPDSLIYARNITDIDDKIMAAADEGGVPFGNIAERWERAYLDDMGALGVQRPDIAPHATAHVGEMIAMIAGLVAQGVAYAAEGHVLFHVPADPDYGSLSGRDADAIRAGARVEVAPYKRDPADFVLWKPSSEAQPGWDSRWGRGRPGWHIECSAMIGAHLGQTIDIHGGGQDLIFPHHENEAAQSRAAHGGAELSRIWMHNGFLNMGADKMSKSLGNIISPRELLEAGWDGEVIRLALLSAHYRKPLEWNDNLLLNMQNKLQKWQYACSFATSGDAEPIEGLVLALSNDLNFATCFVLLDRAVAEISKLAAKFDNEIVEGAPDKEALRQRLGKLSSILTSSLELLGLGVSPTAAEAKSRRQIDRRIGEIEVKTTRLEREISALVTMRDAARRAKDFASADMIRDQLEKTGVRIIDRPDGSTWAWK